MDMYIIVNGEYIDEDKFYEEQEKEARIAAYYESEYAGTYVHDVRGWSDDLIEDALDGEADAYWNID